MCVTNDRSNHVNSNNTVFSTTAQCDKTIKVKKCAAYEVTKLKKMNMEENPSYEEVKSQ